MYAIAVAAICMGAVMTCLVYALNVVFLNWPYWDANLWRIILMSTCPTAAMITVIVNLFITGTDASNTDAPPPLLKRLPHKLRGTIYHLSAQDHYTRVTTTRGSDLILLRFSDALDEISTIPGLQCHRSHWVALSAIRSVTRKGDGAEITITGGTTVPVSRSRLGKLREQGLL